MVLSKKSDLSTGYTSVDWSDEGPLKTHEMTISADAAQFIIQYLTDLYKDPVVATVRETVSNAIDATLAARESGADPDPVEVESPSLFSPTFRVIDHGVGMDSNRLLRNFADYGKSTKMDDLMSTGSKGLGAKAPLAYTTTCMVKTVRDGHSIVLTLNRGEHSNEAKIIYDGDTDDPNGTTIEVPVRAADVDRFRRAVDKYAEYATPDIPILIDGVRPKFDEEWTRLLDIPIETRDDGAPVMGTVYAKRNSIDSLFRLWMSVYGNKRSSRTTEAESFIKNYVIVSLMGWPYDLNDDEENGRMDFKSCILIRIVPGVVDFPPSRDSIKRDDRLDALRASIIHGLSLYAHTDSGVDLTTIWRNIPAESRGDVFETFINMTRWYNTPVNIADNLLGIWTEVRDAYMSGTDVDMASTVFRLSSEIQGRVNVRRTSAALLTSEIENGYRSFMWRDIPHDDMANALDGTFSMKKHTATLTSDDLRIPLPYLHLHEAGADEVIVITDDSVGSAGYRIIKRWYSSVHATDKILIVIAPGTNADDVVRIIRDDRGDGGSTKKITLMSLRDMRDATLAVLRRNTTTVAGGTRTKTRGESRIPILREDHVDDPIPARLGRIAAGLGLFSSLDEVPSDDRLKWSTVSDMDGQVEDSAIIIISQVDTGDSRSSLSILRTILRMGRKNLHRPIVIVDVTTSKSRILAADLASLRGYDGLLIVSDIPASVDRLRVLGDARRIEKIVGMEESFHSLVRDMFSAYDEGGEDGREWSPVIGEIIHRAALLQNGVSRLLLSIIPDGVQDRTSGPERGMVALISGLGRKVNMDSCGVNHVNIESPVSMTGIDLIMGDIISGLIRTSRDDIRPEVRLAYDVREINRVLCKPAKDGDSVFISQLVNVPMWGMGRPLLESLEESPSFRSAVMEWWGRALRDVGDTEPWPAR